MTCEHKIKELWFDEAEDAWKCKKCHKLIKDMNYVWKNTRIRPFIKRSIKAEEGEMSYRGFDNEEQK